MGLAETGECKPSHCHTQTRVQWCLFKVWPIETKLCAPATLGVMWSFYLHEWAIFDACGHWFSHEKWAWRSADESMCCLSHSVAMGREQQENKRAIQNTRHELSQQSAVSTVSVTHRRGCICVSDDWFVPIYM